MNFRRSLATANLAILCFVIVGNPSNCSATIVQDNRQPNQAGAVTDDEWLSQAPPDVVDKDGKSSMLIPTAKSIELFRSKLRKNENDVASAAVLGQLYIRQAKENDDFASYVLAEKVLSKALLRDPTSISAKAYLAEALMAQHRFSEAEKLASEVTLLDSNATLSLGTLGDANMQLGHYDRAEKAYQTLLQKSKSPPVLVRVARLYEIRGQTDQALKLLKQALELQRQASGTKSKEAWYAWRLGKSLFDTGDIEGAKELFLQANALDPQDATSMAALGWISAVSGKTADAVSWYEKAIAASEEPPILIQLGDVISQAGEAEKAKTLYTRAEALMNEEADDPLAGPAHARERAIYFSNHDRRLPEALELAKKDLEVRQDVFSYDTLAWALFKNDKLDAAASAADKAMALGTRDANILYHAGRIKLAQNDKSGVDLIQQALEINPYFSILESTVAKKFVSAIEPSK